MRQFVLSLFVVSAMCITGNAQKECLSHEYLSKEILNDPRLAKRIRDLDGFVSAQSNNGELPGSSAGSNSSGLALIKIPVVVHVVYNSPEQKISYEQVKSQIDRLNKDFRHLHEDRASIPETFKALAADCYIEFTLATIDPEGRSTHGIIWKKTTRYSFGMDDGIKFSDAGGDNAWNSDKYLNIWVGNLSAGIIGYSSPVGVAKEKDGIVIRYTAFGEIGNVSPPYAKGRTAVHEIGHWLGLKHIWGDKYCGDDGIDDTPPQQSASRGCPTGTIVSCKNEGNMYMNYMDLTNDGCTNMFTSGQRNKMRALFAVDGPRHALLFSNGSSGDPLPEPIVIPVVEPVIKVFPNPVQNKLSIRVPDEGSLGKMIFVYNAVGQVVNQVQITKMQVELNVDNLQNGLYFIRIGQKNKSYKFVKVSRDR